MINRSTTQPLVPSSNSSRHQINPSSSTGPSITRATVSSSNTVISSFERPVPFLKLTPIPSVFATWAKNPPVISGGATSRSGVGDGVRVGIEVGVGMMGVALGTIVGGAVIRIIVGTPAMASLSAGGGSRVEFKMNTPMAKAKTVNKMPANSQKTGELPTLIFSCDCSFSNAKSLVVRKAS